MGDVRISALHPKLSTMEFRRFRATVSLIWPYSASAREFALLLAEPDFRLRQTTSQVRARFSGSSAKAMAATKVGIGDEMILGLRGAEFVQDGVVSTPGKSIDWEIVYTQTVVAQVFRNGSEMVEVNMDNVALSPSSPAPLRQYTVSGPGPNTEWSSPAFPNHVQTSERLYRSALHDFLAAKSGQDVDKKPRRESHRYRKVWAYSSQIPSPGTSDDIDDESRVDELLYSLLTPSQDKRGSQMEPAPPPVAASRLGISEDRKGSALGLVENI
tara:strand:+ start:4482 stop:5294 length:813 start_codon:yes stop_codon:yes gene_type:complete